MKLYYHPLSPFSRKPRIAAHVLNLKLDTQEVNLFAGEGQSAEFLAINPNGKVPTLVDGDFCLWESNAIVNYLAMKAGESPLFPTAPQPHADLLRWQFWEASSLSPACMVYVYENMIKPMLGRGEPDVVELEKGRDKFERCVLLLNNHLSVAPWLVGESMTLADICVAVSFMHAETAKYPMDGHTYVADWLNRIRQMPAWLATDPSVPSI